MLLAPPQAQVEPAAEPAAEVQDVGVLAVQWRGDAQPTEDLRAALRDAIAEQLGRPAAAVPDHAVDRARTAIAHAVPVELRAVHREVRAGLDRADAGFRAGEFADTKAELGAVLSTLRSDPLVPGAAASAREAHLLAARVAWAQGDVAAAEAALAEALRLDPEAELSARRAPPGLVERYVAQRRQLLDGRAGWPTPELSDFDRVEIDGVPGLRPVPPGEHLFVVRRDGHEPIAQWRDASSPWTVPESRERLTSADPDDQATLERVCDAAQLDVLVLAERRAARVGLQAHRCGRGLGEPWFGPRERLAEGVAAVLGPGEYDGDTIALVGAWPPPVDLTSPPVDGPPLGPAPRPWYRKGWIWGTSVAVAGIVAGSVAAGVLIGPAGGGRPVQVDADDFIGE